MISPTAKSHGEIRADAMYTLDELKRRSQLGTAALRTARRNGLPVLRIGRRSYVSGGSFIQWPMRTPAESELAQKSPALAGDRGGERNIHDSTTQLAIPPTANPTIPAS